MANDRSLTAASNGRGAVGDEDLRAALEEANVPTLLMVLAHLTGEDRWLEQPYRPQRARGLDDNDSGGLPEGVQATIRDAALDAVRAWRAGRIEPDEPAPERIAQMLEVALAEEVPESYGELLAEELGIAERDTEMPPPPPADEFRVLVIGSGLSGLCAAIKLERAGIAYTVVEKNSDLGGTWFENVYPGCGVDTPSHLYSFSFAPNTAWSGYFAKRPQVHEYLEQLADRYDVQRNIRFNTEVSGARYDSASAMWHVDVEGTSNGGRETLTANVVITAVGITSRPAIPPIEGLERFEGPRMHTAQWRDDVGLEGRRVAVIGTGASSMQAVPAIAGIAQKVLVFQRSPQWALPHPNYKRDVSPAVRLLMEEVPFYAGWYRLRSWWNFGDRLHSSLLIDPDWPHPERSINEINERHRVFLTEYVKEQLGDRTDLLDACLPSYPPYGKRPLIDNGWFRTVCRDDVELVTGAVEEVRPNTVVTASGDEHEADVIILATGFKTLQFLWPMEIRGRSGRTLRETWGEDDARAHLGMSMPDFPNLFFINGPNTSAGHGGSAIIATEFETRYIMQVLGHMIEHGLASVECRREAFDAYNEELDEALSRTIWSHRGMTTYYRNKFGRIVTTSPWKYIDFWNRTREPDFQHFVLESEPGVLATPAARGNQRPE